MVLLNCITKMKHVSVTNSNLCTYTNIRIWDLDNFSSTVVCFHKLVRLE